MIPKTLITVLIPKAGLTDAQIDCITAALHNLHYTGPTLHPDNPDVMVFEHRTHFEDIDQIFQGAKAAVERAMEQCGIPGKPHIRVESL